MKPKGSFKEATRPEGEHADYLYRIWGLNKYAPENSIECFRCIDIAEWQCQKCERTVCRNSECHKQHEYEHMMDKIAL
jgi:hypothetical protein